MASLNAQPTGNVSPTTAHCGSPHTQSILPRSWINPGKLEPARIAGGANRLGGLQIVLDLAQICIRIAVVYQGVEALHHLPDARPRMIEANHWSRFCFTNATVWLV